MQLKKLLNFLAISSSLAFRQKLGHFYVRQASRTCF